MEGRTMLKALGEEGEGKQEGRGRGGEGGSSAASSCLGFRTWWCFAPEKRLEDVAWHCGGAVLSLRSVCPLRHVIMADDGTARVEGNGGGR